MKGSRGGGGVDRCFYNCILWNAGNLDREELKWTPHTHSTPASLTWKWNRWRLRKCNESRFVNFPGFCELYITTKSSGGMVWIFVLSFALPSITPSPPHVCNSGSHGWQWQAEKKYSAWRMDYIRAANLDMDMDTRLDQMENISHLSARFHCFFFHKFVSLKLL